MAGPGGKEVGRLAVKVVPDTDGFTAKVKAVAEKAEQNEVDIPLDLDTGKAEAKLKKLVRTRTAKIKVKLDTKKAEAKLKALAKGRKGKVTLDADTKKAEAKVKKAARDRTAKLQLRFTGDEAVERARELAKDKVQRVKIDLDDRNARTKLRVLGKKSKLIADLEVDEDNLDEIEDWVRSLGKGFKKAARELSEGVDRAAAERLRRQMEAEQKKNDRLARQAQERLGRRMAADIERQNRQVARQQEQVWRETSRRLQQQLRRMGSDFPDRIPIEVAIDPKRRMEAFQREVNRLERERIRIEADLAGENGIRARIAALTRDRRMRIRADIDRSSFGRAGYFAGKVFRAFGGAALGSIGGIARGLAVISAGMGNVGNIGQKAFGRVSEVSQKAAGSMGTVSNLAAQVTASLMTLTVSLTVIYAIVSALGALIVAAIGAVAALASVVIAAAGLLALPAIFAGIGVAIINLSDDNSKLKKQFGELKNTMVTTFSKVGSPMINFFSDSILKMNKALQKGTPLYRQLRKGFEESTTALTPLREGLGQFAFKSLTGVNDALEKLNKSGSFSNMSAGLGGLGDTLGNFASRLADYGPQISVGFNNLVDNLDKLGVSVADWLGSFSGDAPDVIDSFTDATTRLLDAYSKNSGTYSTAARRLGDSLNYAVPGIENITAALANMSPGIFDSIAAGINQLGAAVSDPNIQQGLMQLTQMVIDLSAHTLAGLTKAVGHVGNHFKSLGDGFDLLRGKLQDTKAVSVKEFRDLIEGESTTREKINKGLQQLGHSLKRSSHDIGNWLIKYADQASDAMEKVEGKSGEHGRKLAQRLQELAKEWNDAGGKVGEGWHKSWNEISKQIDQSGSATLKLFKDQMDGLVKDSDAFRERIKANFIAALESKGIKVDDSIISLIDQQLGILSDTAGKKSLEAVNNIQRNFALLPGIIQTAMNEARTPEQLQQKLMAVQKVMDSMTPQIAQSFAKLPTEMQKTLSESSAAFTSWTGMETLRQKVVTAVNTVRVAFASLNPAIGIIRTSLSSLSTSAASAGQGFHVFNNRVHWTHWIMGQIASSAGRTGTAMSRIGTGASSAASAMHRLNSSANAAHSSFAKAGSSAQQASSRIMYLRGVASNAGSGMTIFATTLTASMSRAHAAVQSGVTKITTSLKRLPAQSGPAGNLSAFVSSIQSSMSRARGVVSSAVGSMLAELNRLNTTVTATVNINRNETTRKKTIVEPPSKARDLPNPSSIEFPSPVRLDALAGLPRQFDARAVGASGSIAAFNRTSVRTIREERGSAGSSVVKNYEFNIEAAPDIPTAKQIIKQQRKADALYGD